MVDFRVVGLGITGWIFGGTNSWISGKRLDGRGIGRASSRKTLVFGIPAGVLGTKDWF